MVEEERDQPNLHVCTSYPKRSLNICVYAYMTENRLFRNEINAHKNIVYSSRTQFFFISKQKMQFIYPKCNCRRKPLPKNLYIEFRLIKLTLNYTAE